MTDILEALEEAHSTLAAAEDLKQLAEMPVTGPGKIDRQAVVKLFSP